MAPVAVQGKDAMATALNQTIVEDVVEQDKKLQKNTKAISEALSEIDKSSDLLRTIDQSR